MSKLKLYAKKVYRFIFQDDSIWSWIVNVILAFLIVKFLVYPGLALILGTQLPLVAVISGSMDHEGLAFDSWWAENAEWYEEQGISQEMFDSYKFTNGFNKGDVMILIGANNLAVGDVMVYNSGGHNYPIIHRVTFINEEESLYQLKGDHNSVEDPDLVEENQILGKAVVRIPWIGWIKIWFTELIGIGG